MVPTPGSRAAAAAAALAQDGDIVGSGIGGGGSGGGGGTPASSAASAAAVRQARKEIAATRKQVMAELQRRSQLVVAAHEELARSRAAFEAERRAWRQDQEDVAAEIAAKAADLETASRDLRYERQRWEREWTAAVIARAEEDAAGGGDANANAGVHGGHGDYRASSASPAGSVGSAARGHLRRGSSSTTVLGDASMELAAREAQRLRRAREDMEVERRTMCRELADQMKDAAARAAAVQEQVCVCVCVCGGVCWLCVCAWLCGCVAVAVWCGGVVWLCVAVGVVVCSTARSVPFTGRGHPTLAGGAVGQGPGGARVRPCRDGVGV